MADRQQRIEFPENPSRAQQLALLRDAVLGDRRLESGEKIKGANLKLLLRIIDDYARQAGECFVSQETLAEQAEISLRALQRLLRALVDASLVTCDKRKTQAGETPRNHYRIVWSELALLVPRGEPEADRPSRQNRPTIPPNSADHPARIDRPSRQNRPTIPPNSADHPARIDRPSRQNQATIPPESTDHPATPGGTKEAFEAEEAKEPPPPPGPCADSSAATDSSVTWARVVAVVSSELADWRGACRDARQSRLSPGEVLAIVEHYRGGRGAWGPGALHWRIRAGKPGDAASSGWPPPKAEFLAAERKRREADLTARRAMAERAATDQQAADEREAVARAAQLAALPAADQERLLARVRDERPFLARHVEQDGLRSPLVAIAAWELWTGRPTEAGQEAPRGRTRVHVEDETLHLTYTARKNRE